MQIYIFLYKELQIDLSDMSYNLAHIWSVIYVYKILDL